MTAVPAVDYDPFAPDFYTRDPFGTYRWMRDEAPVYWSERWGWWVLTRFEDVRAAALDAETFLSFEGMDIDDSRLEHVPPGSIGSMDNPRHDQVRSVVQPYFLPRRIATLEDGVRRVVRELVASWTWRRSWLRPRRDHPGLRDQAFEVVLARSELTLTVPHDRSILQVVDDAGIGVLSSCAEGTCGTCETAVLDGEPDHRDSVLDADERAAGACMMICVSRSRSPRLVLDL